MQKITNKKTILSSIIILTLLTTGLGFTVVINALSKEADRSREFEVFKEAITIVRKSYVEEIPSKDLIHNAVEGMVESLDSCAESDTPGKNHDICRDAKDMFVKQLSGISEGEADGSEELKAFRDTFATVRETYDEKDRSERLIHNAIKKMIESLDSHSEFMTPEQYQEMQVDAKGEFGGIGIKLAVQKGMLTVTGVLNGTPASKAGIREGDKIIKINNIVTNDMNLEDAIARLRGNPATSVRLAILRGQSQQAEDFTLVREIIYIKSVASRLLGDGVGYVRISQFQKQTASELSGALSELQQKHVRALILDLRDNPGGLVFSAVNVAGHFIPSGKTVVYTMNRKGKKKEYRSRGNDPFSSVPLILLVNEKSASAAEIVAGALKDWERATLVGTRTYGKGSVQTLLPLKDGSAVKITTANYFTPKGNSIQTTGIVPDMLVTQGIKKDARMVLDARDDIQCQTALSHLKHGTVQRGRVPLAVKTAHLGHL